MRLQPGDMQFVYNHHMMHDRTGFRDWPEPEKRRHLLRLWLALPGDRPNCRRSLPSAMAGSTSATEAASSWTEPGSACRWSHRTGTTSSPSIPLRRGGGGEIRALRALAVDTR